MTLEDWYVLTMREHERKNRRLWRVWEVVREIAGCTAVVVLGAVLSLLFLAMTGGGL